MKARRIITAFCIGGMLTAAAVSTAYPCMAAEAAAELAAELLEKLTGEAGTEEESAAAEDAGTQAAGSENGAESSETDAGFSFGDLSGKEFVFSSGVGAWATTLEIAEDGSFSGKYSDSDMGDSGEGYPNGTCYECVFTGQFTQPVRVNDYTWSMQISHMAYANEVGTEQIVDGVRNCYSEAYGLSGAQTILIYLPGAPLDALPEGYRSWITMNVTDAETTVLPFYGLYNEAQEQGFSSYDNVDNDNDEDNTSVMAARVAAVETQAAQLEAVLDEGALSQSELNQKAAELYTIWDDLLNEIWSELKNTLDVEKMSALTDEEIAWISSKESAVSEAGAEFEGGSMQPMVENLKAAEITKERVYVLLDILNGQ